MTLTLNALNPRNHLIIPDSHAEPDDNFRRYDWLGRFIMERRPEVIVQLGDMWDMGSLCHYDKKSKSFVTRNIEADINAGHEAEARMFAPILKFNEQARKYKHKTYQPLYIKILGNHEARLDRFLDENPQLESASLNMDVFKTRLNIKEHVIDFKAMAVVDGVAYSHYFVSGVMGRPVASARALITKKCMSATMGHVHTVDVASTTKPTGEAIRGLIAGSFHDPDHESFAGPQVDNIWWNGLFMKHDVFNGGYDLEEISAKRLMKKYEI